MKHSSLSRKRIISTLKASYDRKRTIKMFLDNLSIAVLRTCDSRNLSYEAASKRCELSSRYFADIARGKTEPTILTLEKLCIGLEMTPKELLLPSETWHERSFREPMPVTQIQCFRVPGGMTTFTVCPQCGVTLEWEYQAFCDRCGQHLSWKNFSKATVILPAK